MTNNSSQRHLRKGGRGGEFSPPLYNLVLERKSRINCGQGFFFSRAISLVGRGTLPINKLETFPWTYTKLHCKGEQCHYYSLRYFKLQPDTDILLLLYKKLKILVCCWLLETNNITMNILFLIAQLPYNFEGGHWSANYNGTQNFISTLSYSLT